MTGFLPASPLARSHSIFGHPCHKLGRMPGRGPKTLSPSGDHSVTTCASAALRGAGLGPCSGTAGGLRAASRRRAASWKPLSPRSPRSVRSDAPPEQTPKQDDENGPHPAARGPLEAPYHHLPRTPPGAYRPHPPPAQCSPLPRAPQIPRGSRSRSSSPSPPSSARLAHCPRPSA